MRLGKIRNPQYRIVIADQRKKRDGRAIEEIGLYHPKEDPSRIEVNSERAQYWLSVGAQPSEPVQRLLELTGDWQKFKGLPAPPPLKVAEAKTDKHEVYHAEAKALVAADEKKATTEKKKPAKKAAKAKADDKPAEGKPAEGKAAEGKAAEGKAAEGKAETKAKADAATEAKTEAKAEAAPTEAEEKAGADAGTES